MGGGNHRDLPLLQAIDGLSPRGRGKPYAKHRASVGDRSIPAWAGETHQDIALVRVYEVYPRVGGGNVRLSYVSGKATGLSPRGRGKPTARSFSVSPFGSIPAWAGETRSTLPLLEQHLVYPRVGGGNIASASANPANAGLSPRGRGKLFPAGWLAACIGSIPAWAGETDDALHHCHDWEVYPRVGGGNGNG